jgi:hypothetical protein
MIYIQKTQPAPICLALEEAKANGTYNCEGVLQQNKIDFKNKCYLCEDKEPHSINTEHFIPHRGNKNLKFQWNNLFYCCSHCNNTKLDKVKYDSILNCTVEADAVETNIRYHINPFPMEQAEFTPILLNDLRVSNTIDLLLEVYNGSTPLKKIESGNLRSKLLKEIRSFQDLLFDFYDDTFNDEEKIEIKNKIIRQLRPMTNFTAFKKWVLRDNEKLRADFGDYL